MSSGMCQCPNSAISSLRLQNAVKVKTLAANRLMTLMAYCRTNGEPMTKRNKLGAARQRTRQKRMRPGRYIALVVRVERYPDWEIGCLKPRCREPGYVSPQPHNKRRLL